MLSRSLSLHFNEYADRSRKKQNDKNKEIGQRRRRIYGQRGGKIQKWKKKRKEGKEGERDGVFQTRK